MSIAMDSACTSVDTAATTSASSTTSCSPSVDTKTKEVISLDSDDMEVDENQAPPSKNKQQPSTGIDKGKGRAIQSDTDASKTTKRKVLAESGKKAAGTSSSEKAASRDKPVAKKAKLDTSATASTSSQKTEAVVYANDTVQIKNGRLTLKQKKIDWARNTAALQLTISWNKYLEDVEDPLEEIPDEHLPLLVLLGVESDKTSPELAKEVKKLLVPDGPADEESQTIDRLPLPVLTKALGSLLERVNHGLRDPSKEDDEDDRDLPEAIDKVPAAFKIWRWEIKDNISDDVTAKIPEDARQKLKARAEERLEARAATKALLDAMSEEERLNVFKGGKSAAGAKEKASAGSSAAASSSKMEKTSSGEGGEQKKKGRRPKKELTEEEKAEAAEKERLKAEKAAAAAIKKAENEAKKIELDAKRAVKAQKKAEEEEKQRKKDDLMKKQRNALGGWLAKSGTSPIEALNRFVDSPSSDAIMSDVAPARRGSTPVVSVAMEPRGSEGGESDFARAFKPFYVKANTFVAPHNRFTSTRTARQSAVIDAAFTSVSDSLQSLIELADPSRIPSTSKRPDIHSVADLVTAIQEQELVGNMVERTKLLAVLANPDKVPMKLLKFATDVRPGYLGSWTKQSKLVSARRPFAQDTNVLDYEYDSEAEWEEDPEDVEDVGDDGGSAAGDDVSTENEYEVDDWLADDDEQIEMAEGYEGASSLLNPDDMDINDTNSPFASAINAAKKTVKSAVRKKKVAPLIAIIKGPYWADEESDKADDLARYFDSFKIQLLGPAAKHGFVDPLAFVDKPTKSTASRSVAGHPQSSNGVTSSQPAGEKKEMTIKKKMVPSDLMATFEKIVTESEATSKEKLRDELLAAFNGNKAVNKSMLERQIAESCNKRKAKEVGADGTPRLWEMKAATAST